MVIRITGINLKKDTYDKKFSLPQYREYKPELKKLEGSIQLKIIDGIIDATQDFNIEKISENLQKELYDVLVKIENELNGVKKEDYNIAVTESDLDESKPLENNKERNTSVNNETIKDSEDELKLHKNNEETKTMDIFQIVEDIWTKEFNDMVNKQIFESFNSVLKNLNTGNSNISITINGQQIDKENAVQFAKKFIEHIKQLKGGSF